MFIIAVMWFLNFAISFWNAYVCGKSWVESKAIGGMTRLLVWCGAIMSACGFSWCYLIFAALAGNQLGYLNQEQVAASIQLGYLLLIPLVLSTGAVITVDSWVRAWRTRSAADMGIAAWNTFAQAYDAYHAVQNVPGIFANLSKFFGSGGESKKSSSSDDDDNGSAIVVIVLVVAAIGAGILTTYAIIQRFAATDALTADLRERAFSRQDTRQTGSGR